MKYTQKFSDLTKKDAHIAGGKGASLGEMLAANIPVPDGFVVTADTFDYFIKETDLIQEIEAVLNTVDHKVIHTVDSASEKIQSLIMRATMPQAIADEVLEQYGNYKMEYVAVRSSATAEDGADHAWAGQLSSYLNTTKDTLLQQVKSCWASLFTPRAIFYRFEKGLNTTHISVAVVVQKMVNSEKSGIAFSVHPVTEDYNQIIIEAGFGLGEAIVSGSVTPDAYVVTKEPRDILDINVSSQNKALYRSTKLDAEHGFNEWIELSPEQADQQVLDKEQISELANIIVTIEDHYGFPCDIEWAFENNAFYIVQSRPITTLSVTKPTNKEADKIATNSTTEVAWQKMAARTQDLLHWDANISARREKINIGPVYFGSRNDLILKNDVVLPIFFGKNAPINERTNLHEYCKNVSKELEENIEKVITQIKTDLKIVPGETKTDALFLYKTFRRNMGYMLFGLSCSKVPLEFLKESLGDRFLPIKEELLRPHSRTLIARESQAIYLIQNEITNKSAEWLNEQAENLAKEYGFIHSEYVSKSWNAADYKRILQGNVLEINESSDFTQTQFSEYEQWLASIVQKLSYLHDEGKTALVRANWALRETLKALGLDDSLLRLTEKEFYQWAEADTLPSVEELEERKTHFAILSQGDRYEFFFGKKQVEEFAMAQGLEKTEVQKSNLLEGKVAFAGVVQGKVRIIQTQEDSKLLKEGEILVAGMTTPAYIDAMRKAAAFVTDEGGVICHAAIVAREFRKPCVVGTKVATEILKDGDLVEVDADKGVVRILEKNDSLPTDVTAPKEEFFDKQISLTEWLGNMSHEDAAKHRDEDNEKRERLAVLNEITGIPFDRPTQFSLSDVVDRSDEFKSYLENHGSEKCALRLIPLDNNLKKLRMRGKTVREVVETWLVEQEVDPSKYRADFVPDADISYWSTIFVVSESGIRGEVIADSHEKLTQGFYLENTPISFEYDFNEWKLVPANKEAEEHLKKVVSYLKVNETQKAEISKQLNGTFSFDYLNGYFETVDTDQGLWFIDYNRLITQQIPSINASEVKGDLNGQTACLGKYSGTVSVVTDPASDKFSKGDVLVCDMTSPTFLPLMSQAGAIITNRGGVTCHAAIVARELNIPCVIGTEKATQVLKNGDRVEVDADNGAVRIL